MRGVRTIRSSDAHRARRWDVVVLGGALPGLVAAVRLGQHGARVLVLEESVWEDAFAGLREPFLTTGADPSGVLGAALRALGVDLIDQRRFVTDDVALQVVTRDARIEWGRPGLTAAELTAWGLVKPETARALLRSLRGAAEVEAHAMLEAPIVSSGRRRRRVRADGSPATPSPFARGLPAEVAEAPPALRSLLTGLVRALSDAGAAPPAPEAQARALGSLLGGGSTLAGRDGLRGLLGRRVAAVFGERRRLAGRFELVSVAGQPAVASPERDEILAGRVLVLNAPLPTLADALTGDPPAFLRAHAASAQRVVRHYRIDRDALPEGMGQRLVYVPRGADRDPDTARPVVRLHALPGAPRRVDLVASAVGTPERAREPGLAAWIDRVVRELIPFSEDALRPHEPPRPVWDRDDVLVDAAPHGSWPSAGEIRLLGRPAIYALDRGITGGLGFEGELLLGWRAGDAIADELP